MMNGQEQRQRWNTINSQAKQTAKQFIGFYPNMCYLCMGIFGLTIAQNFLFIKFAITTVYHPFSMGKGWGTALWPVFLEIFMCIIDQYTDINCLKNVLTVDNPKRLSYHIKVNTFCMGQSFAFFLIIICVGFTIIIMFVLCQLNRISVR